MPTGRKVTSYCSLRNLSVSRVSQTNKNKEGNVRRDIGGTLMAYFYRNLFLSTAKLENVVSFNCVKTKKSLLKQVQTLTLKTLLSFYAAHQKYHTSEVLIEK